jgi:glycosyltransferase involved in cell wall biosynthesis
MKIVAIAGSRVPSDTANSIQVMKACSALAQLGHELTLIVPGDGQVTGDGGRVTWDALANHYGLSYSFKVEWLTSSSRRLFTFASVRRALKHNPDLLYVWLPQSAVFGLLARVPIVFEIHIQPSGLLGPTWHRLFAKLPGRKRLACITRAMQKILEDGYRMTLRPSDVVIAPNGVELERFASLPDPERARQPLGLREAPTVMCAGHLYAGRGADLFLQLAESAREASFVWVGGRPSDVQEWSEKAKARGLDNVAFLGFVPNLELPRYLAAADVLLMPYARSIFGSSGSADSASVASPMKMFEYMATGRAILTSDLPVIREVLDESSAVFCEPGDAAAWTSALKSLLDGPARRQSLASTARRQVEEFTWLTRAKRILDGFLES